MNHVFYTSLYDGSRKKNNQQDPRLDDLTKQYQRLLAEGKGFPRSAFGARVLKLMKSDRRRKRERKRKMIERHHKKRLLT